MLDHNLKFLLYTGVKNPNSGLCFLTKRLVNQNRGHVRNKYCSVYLFAFTHSSIRSPFICFLNAVGTVPTFKFLRLCFSCSPCEFQSVLVLLVSSKWACFKKPYNQLCVGGTNKRDNRSYHGGTGSTRQLSQEVYLIACIWEWTPRFILRLPCDTYFGSPRHLFVSSRQLQDSFIFLPGINETVIDSIPSIMCICMLAQIHTYRSH